MSYIPNDIDFAKLSSDVDTFTLEVVKHDGAPAFIDGSAYVATLEDAQRFVADFPKSLRLRAHQMWTQHDGPVGSITFRVELLSNGVTGEANETGVKRYRSMRQHFAKRSIVVRFMDETLTQNGHKLPLAATEDELDAFIG